jgi:hypothetical protein
LACRIVSSVSFFDHRIGSKAEQATASVPTESRRFRFCYRDAEDRVDDACRPFRRERLQDAEHSNLRGQD